MADQHGTLVVPSETLSSEDTELLARAGARSRAGLFESRPAVGRWRCSTR